MPIKHFGDLDYSRIHTPSPPPLISRTCVIKNIQTAEVFVLPSQEEFTLGRGRCLHISDKKLSRRQLSCYVDADNFYFSIRKIGRNKSRLNGKILQDGIEYEVGENAILELRLNTHEFQVNFIPTEYINRTTDYEDFEEKNASNDNLEAQSPPKKSKRDQKTNYNASKFKKTAKEHYPGLIRPHCYTDSEGDPLNSDDDGRSSGSNINDQDHHQKMFCLLNIPKNAALL